MTEIPGGYGQSGIKYSTCTSLVNFSYRRFPDTSCSLFTYLGIGFFADYVVVLWVAFRIPVNVFLHSLIQSFMDIFCTAFFASLLGDDMTSWWISYPLLCPSFD